MALGADELFECDRVAPVGRYLGHAAVGRD
jgi:hypothetical protein